MFFLSFSSFLPPAALRGTPAASSAPLYNGFGGETSLKLVAGDIYDGLVDGL